MKKLSRLFSIFIILLAVFGCVKPDQEKKYIKEKSTFVVFLSSCISDHFALDDLAMMNIVHNLKMFDDIKNAWIIDDEDELLAKMYEDKHEKPSILSAIENCKKKFKKDESKTFNGNGPIKPIIITDKEDSSYIVVCPILNKIRKVYLGTLIMQFSQAKR